jgi:hypothetical protein
VTLGARRTARGIPTLIEVLRVVRSIAVFATQVVAIEFGG